MALQALSGSFLPGGAADAPSGYNKEAKRGESVQRLSSYSILSIRLKKGGYALLNGLSGAMDIVNEDLYNILYERQNSEGCQKVYFDDGFFPNELQEQFIRRGHLTTFSHEDEKEKLAATADDLHKRSRMNPKFTIIPDTDCNYRCGYCFEKHLQCKSGESTVMDINKVDSVYRAIEEISGGTNTDGQCISLYGGEPLNAKNKDVVFRIVETGQSKGYCFDATTNGHDLDAFLPLMGKGGIEKIQVTLDGSRHIHDKRRVALDKSSSYDRVTANLCKLAKETDTKIHVRINADKENADGLTELFTDLEAKGLLGFPQIGYYVTPVFGKDAEPFGNSDVEVALAKLKDSFPNIHVASSQSYDGHMIFRDLLDSTPYRLKSVYCGAAANVYIFMPDGSIASCMEVLGKEHNIIGHYSDEGVTLDREKHDLWMNRSAAKIPQCLDCKYCLVCGGGCPQNAMNRHGNLYTPDCGDFKETYPAILADAAERYLTANNV